MSLLQLPDDILFIILKFSKPHDLFRLRKTCKRLQALTLERTVWRAAYENSRCFLPAGPLHIQTVHNLEKILVRADRWDKIWKQDQRIGYTLGCIWSGRYGLHPNDRQHMELAYSRYLTISGLGNLRVYDLESKCEIFRYQAVGSETLSWFGYSPSAATEGDAASGIFTPFCRNTKLINSRGEVNFYNTKIDVADMSAILAVGHEFFIFKGRDASTTTSLLHIPSQKVYQLPSTLEN
ncbi:hypothetical protein GYMLUDRAFT_644371 [Collybiopsis luxurians FD-317 M1]|nr:hypothetical protein GYMLUDRAFT_644371 [Collybiopsis luxurians FD-317 M1]